MGKRPGKFGGCNKHDTLPKMQLLGKRHFDPSIYFERFLQVY